MLLTPTIGAFFIALSIYSALVMWFPWGEVNAIRLKPLHIYLLSAVITLLIVVPFWGKLISIFPTTDPYRQPLLTGKARIDVIVSSTDKNVGTKHSNSWCYRGRIFLVTGPEQFLEMWIAAIPGIHVERLGNNQLRYSGDFDLHPENETTWKPVSDLRVAEHALVFIYDNIPPDANVIDGNVVFTLNSTIQVKVPIMPQEIKSDMIFIEDFPKYFEK